MVIFDFFSILRPSAILDLLYACLNGWTIDKEQLLAFVNLQNLTGFALGFDNMQVLILCALCLKCIFTPQNVGFGIFHPNMDSSINATP